VFALAILSAVTPSLVLYACSAEIVPLTEGIIGVLHLKNEIPSNSEISQDGIRQNLQSLVLLKASFRSIILDNLNCQNPAEACFKKNFPKCRCSRAALFLINIRRESPTEKMHAHLRSFNV
jgi:hypothetical protein